MPPAFNSRTRAILARTSAAECGTSGFQQPDAGHPGPVFTPQDAVPPAFNSRTRAILARTSAAGCGASGFQQPDAGHPGPDLRRRMRRLRLFHSFNFSLP
ncbi:MAG: hypothetical protein LAT79_09790 [Kiritimatiellae bacterium]|nr:hypothetical protein [Kiritimatiellia bacterium]